MILAGIIFHFYNETQAIAAIDFQTIFLLTAMMILVALMEPTGFFKYLAIKTGKLSGGNPFKLLVFFGVVTTLISMFLNSLTAIILVAPITILICEILGLPSHIYLMAEAIFANLGGTATLIGSVPDIMIGSAGGLTFVDFLTHSLPIVLLTWLVTLAILYLIYRKELQINSTRMNTMMELDSKEALKNPGNAMRVGIVTIVSILFFIAAGPLKISPALVALAGGTVALLLLRPPLQDILKNIHWDLLIFFISLFVIVGGMDSAGVFAKLTEGITSSQHLLPMFFGLLLMWSVALLSAIVDNVPVVIALIPVIQSLAHAGFSPAPLYWAVVLGAGLGGNGTILGSSVNLIAVAYSKRTHHPISSKVWNKSALPITFASMTVASIVYVFLFRMFS